MANEYLIPIGLDFKGQESLNETIEKLEVLEKKGGDVGKTITQEFSKGTKAVEDFDKKIKPVGKNIESIAEAGKLVKNELEKAFQSDQISDFDAKIEKFKARLASISANIDIDIPDDKIRLYEAEIAKATNGVDELRVAMLIAGDVAKNLDPNSEEFKALSMAMNETAQALDDYGVNIEDVIQGSKSMKSELRSIKSEMNQLEASGQAGGERFRELAIRAGELEDQIGDTNSQIRTLASDTKYIDGLVSGVQGLVGAFTLVQGAVGLFAGENEDLQKALLKVNSAMAILQGLQAVSDALNKDSAFSVIYLSKAKQAYAGYTLAVGSALGLEATATGGATLATKAFSLALASIGIGLIIIAIIALVEYWDELTSAFKDILPAGASVGKTFDTLKSVALGLGNVIIQNIIAPFKIVMALMTDGISGAVEQAKKSYNVLENFTEGKRTQDLRNQKKHLNEIEQNNITFAKRELERRANRGEDVAELQRRNLARQLKFNKNNGIESVELQKEYEDNIDKAIGDAGKKREADSKKASEDAKKRREKAEADRKKALEDSIANQKKQNDQIAKFASELEDSKIRNIEDSSKRQRDELENQFNDKIKAIESETALTAKAKNQQSEILVELEKEKSKKLKEFDEKVLKDKLQIQSDANKEIQNLSKDSLEKELSLLALSSIDQQNAIREKYKSEEALKIELLEASEKSRAEKEKEIKLKYAKEGLKNEEEIALLNVELMSSFAKKSEETELQKQIAIQQVKLDFAKQNLQLLLDSGSGENDIEVLKAKKIVQDTSDALDEAIKKNSNKPFDLMSFLGIGEGLSKDQKDSMKKAFNQIGDSLGELTDFMVSQYDRQINKKQEAIDQIDGEIGNLEDQLDEEKSLREQGFANNVDLIEQQIAVKQKEKDEEIRQQKQLIEEKKQMQKTQLAIDTAMQLSGLITSSVEIFKSLAGIPFVGIPLAIATIGTMFGAFSLAKVKAYQSINDQGTKFRKGGAISGKSHEMGGVKYYSEDGKNIELEGDEFVFSNEKHKKYGKLLHAMNFDDFNGLTTSDAGVVELFKKLGFATDISQARKSGNELQLSLMSIGLDYGKNTSMDEVNFHLKELIRLQKETPTSYSDGSFNYLKEGNKVIKTRIKQPIIEEENDSSK